MLQRLRLISHRPSYNHSYSQERNYSTNLGKYYGSKMKSRLAYFLKSHAQHFN